MMQLQWKQNSENLTLSCIMTIWLTLNFLTLLGNLYATNDVFSFHHSAVIAKSVKFIRFTLKYKVRDKFLWTICLKIGRNIYFIHMHVCAKMVILHPAICIETISLYWGRWRHSLLAKTVSQFILSLKPKSKTKT